MVPFEYVSLLMKNYSITKYKVEYRRNYKKFYYQSGNFIKAVDTRDAPEKFYEIFPRASHYQINHLYINKQIFFY